ncbi:hypothetical protein CAP2UW1_1026 [Candidatus Accumulibacter phosphatis]|uniref:Uncharacterized protein n=1 Tax=Accumulibacter regalis TaxID=522306 RepID=C7RQL4_ACCRE
MSYERDRRGTDLRRYGAVRANRHAVRRQIPLRNLTTVSLREQALELPGAIVKELDRRRGALGHRSSVNPDKRNAKIRAFS